MVTTKAPFVVTTPQTDARPAGGLVQCPLKGPNLNDVIVVQEIAGWEKLKALVLDSVSSPITKRVYNMALNEFLVWMSKRIAAVALQNRIGETFAAVVTGVTPKGVFVRISGPPAEGLLVRGQQGVDVGDQLKVKLVSTDPQHGYLDFAKN
jgi:hypothetical protein